MKKQFILTIPKACSEHWENFTPTANGGFCASCSKVVVDFSTMNDDQIIHYFSKRRDQTCGRFRSDQLKDYSLKAPLTINPGWKLLKAGFLCLFIVLVSKPGMAITSNNRMKSEVVRLLVQQNGKRTVEAEYIIKGIIKSEEDNEPLPGVTIYLKGSTEGTVSDTNGQFEFPTKLKAGDILVFSFIGLETKEYTVPNEPKEVIEIRMALSYCILLGEVSVSGVDIKQQSGFRSWWQKVKGIF